MTDLAERANVGQAVGHGAPTAEEVTRGQRVRRKRRDFGAAFGAAWIIIVVVGAIITNWLPLPDPDALGSAPAMGPSWGSHPLGTDGLGRDTLARLVYGARVSMAVAIGATTAAMIVGVTLGMIAGYFGRLADSVIALIINYTLSFPPIIFLMALVAALEPSLPTLVIGLAVLGVPTFARVARANTIAFAERDFVVASRALGAGPVRILVRQLLANVMVPVMSLALVVMASLVVAEGTLSFLGMGVPPPTPSWGGMLSAGRDSLEQHPHLVLIPAACFFLTVFSFNRIGDWLRGRVGQEGAI